MVKMKFTPVAIGITKENWLLDSALNSAKADNTINDAAIIKGTFNMRFRQSSQIASFICFS